MTTLAAIGTCVILCSAGFWSGAAIYRLIAWLLGDSGEDE